MSRSSKLENPHSGVTAPINLYIGRIWHEITTSGLYIGSWIWNGTYWLSFQTFDCCLTTASVNAATTLTYPIDTAYNIFLLNAIATIQCTANANPAINWGWAWSRVNSAGTATTIVSANNAGQAANTWQTFKTLVNQHINVANTGAVGLRLAETRNGAINKTGSIKLEYKRVRI
jgi:hypothetical protein